MQKGMRVESLRAHRAAYIAIINRCLDKPGSKRRFARQLDITPQHLSYLLAQSDEAGEERSPSPALARRIARHLPLAAAERGDLLEHMLAAHRARPATLRTPDAEACTALVAVAEDLLARAQSTPHPDELRHATDLVMRMCEIGLGQVGPRSHPLAYIRYSLCLAECLMLRGHHSMAIFRAHLAEAQLGLLDRPAHRGTRSRIDMLDLSCAELLGRIYVELGQSRPAQQHLDRAAETAVRLGLQRLWLPRLAVTQARLQVARPRFSVREVESLLERAEALLGPDAPPLCLRLGIRWVELYLARALPDHAALALRERAGHIADGDAPSVIDHIDLLAAKARLLAQQGSDAAHGDLLRSEAHALAERAGLTRIAAHLASPPPGAAQSKLP
ncbi:MAG: hypothetical protein H6648_02060 [Caldilineae bacterium]|nr:hypothetical protein [Caldilineae bacterium]